LTTHFAPINIIVGDDMEEEQQARTTSEPPTWGTSYVTAHSANKPNAETLEALEEAERMEKDPSIGKTYTDVDKMFSELLADVNS